ncbi:MAG: ABC transporter substrate-binding protein [Candidatus Bathyarchaeota archaeon]|nr:ABC transporter substrate-binding protein [Candidatus Bathyarchaeota archaeon]
MSQKKLTLITILMISIILTSMLAVPIAGAEDEKYFFEFSILVISGFESHRMMAEMIQNELGQIGIKASIEQVGFGVFMDRLNKAGSDQALAVDDGFDTWLVQFGDSGELDPDNMGTLFHSKNQHPGWNKGAFYNGQFDAILDEAAVLSDMEDRKTLYSDALHILAEEVPSATIAYLKDPWVMRSDVEGFDTVLGCYGLGAYTWSLSDQEGGTVQYAQPGSLPSLNPTFAGAGTTLRAVGHTVWEALMDSDSNFNPVGELAESWTVSDDGLVWTFTLHDGVLWHDNEPFTTQDIITTFDAIMDIDTAMSSYYDFDELVDSYRAIDDKTFEVILKIPSAAAWSKIFTQEIWPDHIMADVPHMDWKSHPLNTQLCIGTGPFKMVEWQPEEYVKLEVNTEYYRGRAPLDTLYFVNIPDAATAMAALEKGDVHVLDTYYSLGNEVPQIEANEDLKYVLRINPGAVHLMFNLNHPMLGNKYVRKAISATIPRADIVANTLAGLGDECTSFIHPLTWAYDSTANVPSYDLEQAKAYMELAGFKYEYLEPEPTIPVSSNLLPAVGGAVIGLIIGALAISFLKKP